jgi:hypothetical protein
MAMSATAETFSIGRVVSRTFSVIGRNAIPFFALGLVAAVPQVAFSALLQRNMLTSGTIDPTAIGPGFWFGLAGSWLLAIVLVFFLQAALVQATVRSLNGQSVSIGDAFMTALRVVIPLIALGIVSTIGIAVGFVLLVFPGLMLACAWVVCVPALVVERAGILGSLSRSAELTRGHRWAILGLFVLYIIALIVINMALGPILGISMLGAQPGNPSILFVVMMGIYTAVQYTVSAAGTASIYYELRTVKEGVGPQQLASVFE